MAFSLRLPPALDNEARIRAEQVGVPLNALICFALDFYLRGGVGHGQAGAVVDALDMANPSKLSHGGMPLKARSVGGLASKLGSKPSNFTIEHAQLPKAVPVPVQAVPKPLVNVFGQKLTRGQRRSVARAAQKKA
jgi:hypothetical protein